MVESHMVELLKVKDVSRNIYLRLSQQQKIDALVSNGALIRLVARELERECSAEPGLDVVLEVFQLIKAEASSSVLGLAGGRQ